MFLGSQFRIKGYKIFRLDLNRFGGELILQANHYTNTSSKF